MRLLKIKHKEDRTKIILFKFIQINIKKSKQHIIKKTFGQNFFVGITVRLYETTL